MTSVFKPLLLAGALALAGLGVNAQPMGMGGMQHNDMDHGPMMGRHDRGAMSKMDPAKMQAAMEKRAAALKARLKITAAQEGAWNTFTQAMKPGAEMLARREQMHADMGKMTTPQRIDHMRAQRTERMAAMDKRADAVKAFYAALSPEQQKIFDTDAMHQHARTGKRGGPGGTAPAPTK